MPRPGSARRRSRISRSRLTLARMLAAATTRQQASALITRSTWPTYGETKSQLPSTIAASGTTDSWATARLACEALRRGHAQLVALDLGGVADTPGRAPRGDAVEQPLAVDLGEHLRVADPVDPAVAWQHGGADRERPGPRAAADLVDADDDRVAELPQLLLDRPRRRVLLRQRSVGRAAQRRHRPRLRAAGRVRSSVAMADYGATRVAGGVTVAVTWREDGGHDVSNRAAARCSPAFSTPSRRPGTTSTTSAPTC